MMEDIFIKNPDESVPSNNRFLKSPELVDLLKRPTLLDPVESVLGSDLFLWRIGTFIKGPKQEIGRNEIPWHQDRHYWPIEPALVCSAWLAIDDVDLENSPVHFIPGTHRELIPHIASLEHHRFGERADPEYFDVSKAVPVTLKAGQFVLFNERLLHWSAPNTSDRRRFGLAVRILPPQVRVLEYDCDQHGLVQLRGGNPLGFNRLVTVPTESPSQPGRSEGRHFPSAVPRHLPRLSM